ncbi:MAG: hypothetical protein A2629_00260 [Candidatus Levybacteria bacterium RIFCSPHIGHO2_01_FULL_41_15]|nr:MAG: hypothetical protein A2629_00260 [Candidatus Levybacteria bacterium RIFCSPHIGHO2_01_FULL_41_15]
MHRKKIKRKGKIFLKILVFYLFAALFFGLLIMNLYRFPFFSKDLISPLAKDQISGNKSIEEILRKENIPYSSVSVASDSSYLVDLRDGGQAIISKKKDIQEQINSLQLMLNRLTIEGKRIKTVDFRFDRPILRL